MIAQFVHQIDPVIAQIGNVYLWWYGLSYTLGFLGIYFWLRRNRERLCLTLLEAYDATIILTAGVLVGGRFVEIVFYEWDYYRDHLLQMPAYWLGGMSTHGLLLGAIVGTMLFSRLRGKKFLAMVDELVIPGAWIMGVGRIGNFIDGQISGAPSEVLWAVQFPDLEGFRHPVVLYDGLKNLLLIPVLLLIRRANPPPGALFANFVFWYAFLRLFVDRYRDYRVESFGLGTGQMINIGMSLIGLVLLFWFYRKGSRSTEPAPQADRAVTPEPIRASELWTRRVVLGSLLLFCLTMPSDWTQDVPKRYGDRHPGMEHSWLYPVINRGPR